MRMLQRTTIKWDIFLHFESCLGGIQLLVVEEPSPVACIAHNIFGETPVDSLLDKLTVSVILLDRYEITKGGGDVDMVMCEDDMSCCCCLVHLNNKARGSSRRLRPMATLSSSPSRKFPSL
jgi:hypothetical protein